MKIISIGEALIDFAPYEKEGTYIKNFGGAPANVAVVVSRLGMEAEFIGKVGMDQFGLYIQEFFKREKVHIKERIATKRANTTLSFVHLDAEGNRNFEFIRNPGADMFLEEKDIEEDFCNQGDIVHFGSAQLMIKSGRDTLEKAIRIAKKVGATISFDPNYRAAQWECERIARKTILEYAKKADIIKISHEEARWLCENGNEKEAAEKIQSQCGKTVVMTCGGKGAYYTTETFAGFVKGYPQRAVDTTGAGDVFWGTFLRFFIEKIKPEKSWAEGDFRKIIEYSNAAGALCVREKGAITPELTLKRILEFHDAHSKEI